MPENKPDKKAPFNSLDELVESFDRGDDWGDYLDLMPEVHFNRDIKRRRFLIAVDADLIDKLTAVAKAQHTSTESLINSWLREKVNQAS